MSRFRTATLAAALTIFCSIDVRAQELVVNESFELIPTTGWQGLSDNFVTSNTAFNSFGAHTGRMWLSFACAPALCSTFQHVTTVAGQAYTFSFWSASDGMTSNDMVVSWGANTLLSLMNDVSHGWQKYSFDVVGTGDDLVLFRGRSDTGHLSIDDVSVMERANTVVPEPGTVGLLAIGLIGTTAAARGRRKRTEP